MQGWFAGAGGGISMKVGDSIYVAPSAVPIDRLEADDLFVLRKDGTVSQSPANAAKASPDKKFALSHCSPLFMNAYKSELASAVKLKLYQMKVVRIKSMQDG